MKNKLHILSLILTCIFLAFCKNENVSLHTEFEVGQLNSNLVVDSMEVQFSFPFANNMTYCHDIDVNNSGETDLQICRFMLISVGGLNNQKINLKCVNASIETSFEVLVDTLFSCITSLNDTTNFTTTFNNFHGYECNDEDSLTIEEIADYEFSVVHQEGDKLTENLIFTNEDLIIDHFNYTNNLFEQYFIKRGNWSNLNQKFILFRFLIEGEFKYGWIKLSKHGANFTIHEIAMEE